MYRYYKGFDEKKHIAMTRFYKFNKYVNYYKQIHIYVNKLYICTIKFLVTLYILQLFAG